MYLFPQLLIVDDVFLMIGSANQNLRSFTSDPEMSVGIVDTEHITTVDGQTVGKLVFETRLTLFNDHL